MKKSKNPKLKEGDRIILVYMDGESLDPGTKGLVIGLEKVPKFSPNDLGYAYKVKWYDEDTNNPISALSLLPETDSWMYDFDNIQEVFRFSNGNDENSTEEEYNFISLFKKSDFKRFLEYVELIRQSGLVNMLESSQFYGNGREYLQKFIDLHTHGDEIDDEKEEIYEKLLNNADFVRNMFISAAINKIESGNGEITAERVRKNMILLIKRAFQQYVLNKNGNFNR
jgi:hypothetical protein